MHYCRLLGVGNFHLKKKKIEHQYDTWLWCIVVHRLKPQWNLTLRHGHLCSWTCIYMCRQMFSFPRGILCEAFIFSIKKKIHHTLCFSCIIILLSSPSRGFSSHRNTAHTLHYCWQKNYLSKYLYPNTITNLIFPKPWPLFQPGLDNSPTSSDFYMLWIEG